MVPAVYGEIGRNCTDFVGLVVDHRDTHLHPFETLTEENGARVGGCCAWSSARPAGSVVIFAHASATIPFLVVPYVCVFTEYYVLEAACRRAPPLTIADPNAKQRTLTNLRPNP